MLITKLEKEIVDKCLVSIDPKTPRMEFCTGYSQKRMPCYTEASELKRLQIQKV